MKWPDELIFMKNRKAIQHTSTTSMKGKLSVITGASSGVGLSTVKALASAQSDIVMVCRNKSKSEPIQKEIKDTYGVNVDLIIADFSNFDDVKSAAQKIIADYPKVDVLINSVGIHSTKKLYNSNGIEMSFCVNHLSVFLFTLLLLDKMKSSSPSRIIQVNSEGHRFSGVKLKDINFKHRIYTGLKGYGQSKSAQLLTTLEINDMLKGTDVTINACHPGGVKTGIGSNNGWLYRFFFKHVTSHFLKDPSISGSALYYLSSDPSLRDVSGKFFNLTIEELPAKHATDRTLSKEVYNLSLEMVGLKDVR